MTKLTQCPVCKGTHTTVLKLHNPETQDMNCDATIRCEADGCKHEWEGRVTSPDHEWKRSMGFVI